MSDWDVRLHNDFSKETDRLPHAVRKRVFGYIWNRFGDEGPLLGEPLVKQLRGSCYGDRLKEIKFRGRDGGWRIAFGIDEASKTIILLVAGDKSGVAEQRFYTRLIKTAERRLDEYHDK